MKNITDSQAWFDKMYTALLPNVHRYVKSLYRIFPWLPDSVDDTVQEVFLCLYEQREKIYNSEKLERWLLKVARNKAFEQCRNYKKHITVFNDFASVDVENLQDIHTDDEHEDLRDYIKLCEARIGEVNFRKLQAYYLEQCSIEQLASEENVSIETMRVKIHRWRKRCAAALKKVIRLNLFLAIILFSIKN